MLTREELSAVMGRYQAVGATVNVVMAIAPNERGLKAAAEAAARSCADVPMLVKEILDLQERLEGKGK